MGSITDYKDHKAKAFIFISNLVWTYFFKKILTCRPDYLISCKIVYETTVLLSQVMWSEAKHMANYIITEEFGWVVSSYVCSFQSLVGPQQEASCRGRWGTYPEGHVHIQTQASVATCNHKQLIWGVLQEKVKGKKKSLISSLFLGSSNVQEKYFIPTQDAKGQWNLWEVPPTYHTKSRAIQAFVGIPVTVTGQAFSRLGKKEPSATCLKQTQPKYFHYWNHQFWSIFSEKNKRIWL